MAYPESLVALIVLTAVLWGVWMGTWMGTRQRQERLSRRVAERRYCWLLREHQELLKQASSRPDCTAVRLLTILVERERRRNHSLTLQARGQTRRRERAEREIARLNAMTQADQPKELPDWVLECPCSDCQSLRDRAGIASPPPEPDARP